MIVKSVKAREFAKYPSVKPAKESPTCRKKLKKQYISHSAFRTVASSNSKAEGIRKSTKEYSEI